LDILKLNKSQAGVKVDLDYQHRSLHNYLMSIINKRIKKHAKILDVGCGTANLLSMLLAKDYDGHGIDAEIRGPISKALYKQGRIEIVDFLEYSSGDSYDLVIFAEVLEHIEDYISFISKGMTLLSPNGSMLISVPNYWTAKITACPKCAMIFPSGGHLWKFKSGILTKDMEQFFSKVEITEYFHPLWVRFPLRYFSTSPYLNCWCGRLFGFFLKRRPKWIVSFSNGLVNSQMSAKPNAEYFENSKEYLEVKGLFDSWRK